MTIYTPSGMPISFSMRYAFTLLARLYPQYRPRKVLKIADGMDKAPTAVAYIMAFILFLFHLSPIIIFVGTLVLPGILSWMQIRSRYIDFVVRLGVIFSILGKFGILFLGLAVFGWYSVGLQGLLAFLGARFVAGFINIVLEAQEKKRIQTLTGTYHKDLEFDRSFIDAYRFCADKIGVISDISISEQEMDSQQWQVIQLDYSEEDPVIFKIKKFS